MQPPVRSPLDVQFGLVAIDGLDRATRGEIIALCEAAYQEDFTRLFELLPGSVHVLARDRRGVLVSHGEFVMRWLQPAGHRLLRTAYIEAVATAPDWQRRGNGACAVHWSKRS